MVTDGTVIPSRIEGSDADASGLDPIARFVLSQVDGRASAAEIADATMLEPEQVDAMLTGFAQKGLVRYREVRIQSPLPPSATDGASARVDAVHAALGSATHYDVLGVPQDVDKALLKRAYFVLSKEFHPDSSPHRKLPGIRPKLEAIFRRLTDAHDALSRPKRRDAYDDELARAKTPAFTKKLHPPIEMPKSGVAEAAPGAETVATETGQGPARTPVPTPAPPVAAPDTAPGPARPNSVRPAYSTPIGGPRPSGARAATVPGAPANSLRPPAASTPIPAAPRAPAAPAPSPAPPRGPAPAAPAAPSPAAVTGARPASPPVEVSAADRQKSLLRALHGASQVTGPVDKTAHYEQQGIASEATGDFKAAISFYKVAVQLSPEREELRARIAHADKRLAETEVPANRERAKSEEAAKRPQTAALAWSRVALGAPNEAEAHAGAARCMLAAKLDLRQARDFALRSVELAPKNVDYRIVLVRIFQEAGMRLNARREAEAAAKLDPSNQLVKNLQRELE